MFEEMYWEWFKGHVVQSILYDGEEGDIFLSTHKGIYRLHSEYYWDNEFSIEDVSGNPQALVGHEILSAEGAEDENPDDENYWWYFYKLDTFNESVTFRWSIKRDTFYSRKVEITQVEALPNKDLVPLEEWT